MNGIRILLLEDNPSDVYLLKKTLQRSFTNAELTDCDDKTEFEQLIHSIRPDIILSDIALPQYSGYEALMYAKTHFPEVPFVFVTGSLQSTEAINLFRKGASDVLFKDHIDRIDGVIHNALQAAKNRQLLKETARMNRMLSRLSKIGGWTLKVDSKELQWTDQTYLIHGLEPNQKLQYPKLFLFTKKEQAAHK